MKSLKVQKVFLLLLIFNKIGTIPTDSAQIVHEMDKKALPQNCFAFKTPHKQLKEQCFVFFSRYHQRDIDPILRWYMSP